MPLREYVFRTSHDTNPLCRWTRESEDRWILIQLLRSQPQGRAAGAIFTFHASQNASVEFLQGEFGRRYGTFTYLQKSPKLVSVEVTNYLLPTFHGQDPVELATKLLGPDCFFFPILVHGGYIHIRVVATPPTQGSGFPQLLDRLKGVTQPQDFQLVHVGAWDPLASLRPSDDQLTPRQAEVLAAAVKLGYYDAPRRCKLIDVAKVVKVSKAAVHKHLVAAEGLIMRREARRALTGPS